MALKKLQLAVGVNRENTRYASEGKWWESNLVRFRQGTPETVGGWTKLTSNTFEGVCRALFNWVTLGGANYLGVGTHLKFYVETGAAYYDVTPIRTFATTAALTNPFATTLGSTTITVTDAAHGLQTNDLAYFSGATSVGGVPAAELNTRHVVTVVTADSYTITVTTPATSTVAAGGGAVAARYVIYAVTLGANPIATTSGSPIVIITHASNGATADDFVTFSGATPVGGLTLNGEFQIISILTADTYTISASSAATSSATGGGSAVLAAYQINTGPEFQQPTLGWGAGLWGTGTWGVGTAEPDELRLWSQSNFGEDLVMCQRYGGVYLWDVTAGLTARAVDIGTLQGSADAPTTAAFVVVSDVYRFLLAFGCNDYGATTADPMLIRWPDQETLTDWTPSTTNQAGSIRLSRGVEIKCAVQAKQELLVFTDVAVYSMQYLGAPAVWGATLVADSVTIEGPNAVTTAAGVVYWMGVNKFYMYNGTASTLPCDLRQYVFGDLNYDQRYQVFAGSNERFSEVWWFYCSAGATLNDRYVVYNYAENAWYYGQLSRTAWLDSTLRNYPVAAYNDLLLYHEDGVDDVSGATAVGLDAYIASGEFDIDDGDRYGFIYRVLPDITFRGSTATSPAATMTLIPMKNSGSGYSTSIAGSDNAAVTRTAEVPVEQFTGQVYVRVRGRQMVFKVASNALGTAWQLGAPRIDVRVDGRAG